MYLKPPEDSNRLLSHILGSMNIVFTYKSDFQKGKMAEDKNTFRIIHHLKKKLGPWGFMHSQGLRISLERSDCRSVQSDLSLRQQFSMHRGAGLQHDLSHAHDDSFKVRARSQGDDSGHLPEDVLGLGSVRE